MKNVYGVLFVLLIINTNLQAQNSITQTIRGRIIDQETETPLIGALVMVENLDKGGSTDAMGEFIIENVPIGRQSITVTYLGYENQTISNLNLISGKETVLTINMVEKAFESGEVVVIASEQGKAEALNEMATVSTRQFRTEETQRYAGGRGDVSRMAMNFAGVSGANDSRNDIVIRGNSPLGLLWRIEGIDVPNPNHFGGFGSTGGPVSMLNNNVLANSDFSTGAFNAEYGNANSGVFDLKLRNGNNKKYEFVGQMGFNGIELGAEGPINKENNSSFLANYRYSTLSLFDLIGINFGYVGIPKYQDLSFKVNMPKSALGNISIFGVGGISSIDMLASEREEGELNLNGNQDLKNGTSMGVVGLTHRYVIDEKSFTKLTLSGTVKEENTRIHAVDSLGEKTHINYNSNFTQQRYSAKLIYQNKINRRLTFKTGVTGNYLYSTLVDSFRRDDAAYQTIRDTEGGAFLLQGFAQTKYKLTPKWTMVSGLYGQVLELNNSTSLEPRLAFQYQMNGKQRLSIAYGRHAQMQPFPVYFNQTLTNTGDYVETNKDLDFTNSNHFVLGYDYSINENWRLKGETYYQSISNAPIEQTVNSFSMLNYGSDFGNTGIDSLVNGGVGRNYGLELTIEKFFSDHYYLLLTTSLFDSKYAGSDDVWRNTAFNTNYMVNALIGMEFPIGKNNFLTVDLKAAVAGGRRYTPLNEAASLAAGEAVYYEDRAFEEQFRTYFKPDIQLSFRNNMKKYSQIWSISIENFANRENVFRQVYNASTNQIDTEYQLGLFPVFLYKIEF